MSKPDQAHEPSKETLAKNLEATKRALAAKEAEVDKLKGKSLAKAMKEQDQFAGFSGKYKEIATGEIFALKVIERHESFHGRTHLARSESHYGEYTAADFRRLFDKL